MNRFFVLFVVLSAALFGVAAPAMGQLKEVKVQIDGMT